MEIMDLAALLGYTYSRVLHCILSILLLLRHASLPLPPILRSAAFHAAAPAYGLCCCCFCFLEQIKKAPAWVELRFLHK